MENSLQFVKIGALTFIVAVSIAAGMATLKKGDNAIGESTEILLSAIGNTDDSELMMYDGKKISGAQAVELLNVYGLKYPAMITTSQVTSGFYSIDRIAVEQSDQYVQPVYQFTLEVVKDANKDVVIILVTQEGVPRPNYDVALAREAFERSVTIRYEVISKQFEVYNRNLELNESVSRLCKEGMSHAKNSGQNAGSAEYWDSQRIGLQQTLADLKREISARLQWLFM